jgi:hypothetical protein
LMSKNGAFVNGTINRELLSFSGRSRETYSSEYNSPTLSGTRLRQNCGTKRLSFGLRSCD